MDPYAFKYEAARALVASQNPVKFTLDGRHPDVDLPAHLWELPMVELYAGRGGTNPRILDLRLDPIIGLTGTLKFQGVPYHCLVPWAAVYGVGPHLWWGEIPADARRNFDVTSRRRLWVARDPTPEGPHAA